MNVNMLWVQGDLSQLEMRCIASFVKRGYQVTLWTYGEVSDIPAGVTIRDAREILSEDSLFLNRQGSYAGFSDLFRYAVLQKYPGLYADVDVIALKPASELPREAFLVTERMRGGRSKINGNVINLPKPEPGDVVDLAYAYAKAFPKDRITWSEIGPSLLTAIVGIYPEHGFKIMNPHFANPVDWWDCPHRLLSDFPIPECHFMHIYNDMWRRAGVSKNIAISPNSLLGKALAL